jgi:hypothetical protein
MPAFVPQIMVYPIGIPLFFVVTLYSYRERLMEPGVRVQLGFLYEGASDCCLSFRCRLPIPPLADSQHTTSKCGGSRWLTWDTSCR